MKRVYFNEYNVKMDGVSYLPLVSGLLRAYAETFPDIKSGYQFEPFIYSMDEPEKILAQYTEPPDSACFSSVMWNEQLNYHVAQAIKKKYPNCLIVFGGPNVPMPPLHSVEDWMMAHPFVDLACRAEGEELFVDILKRYLHSRDFSDIPNVACRAPNGEIKYCDRERPFKRSMDEYPSPYLEGYYDDLLKWGRKAGHQFQAIIETNRGCPFPCSFCYWGKGGLSRKYRYKNMDKVFAEIEWMGRNEIKYVFNADSNFGMNARDQEIADWIVAIKNKYGFPEKFRTCFGKNTDEKIFKIGALFHENNLEKGITLARQSNDPETLRNIRRDNIKMSTYDNLQKQFNDLDMPVYGELILGLPGETEESWRRGMDELLEAGTKNQLFVYICQVFANTEMATTAYREKFGIKTKRIKLAEIHGRARPPEFVQEYEEVIVETNSMNLKGWKASLKFSYVLMLFHSLKIAYYVMIFLLDRYGIKMSEFIQFVAERRYAPAQALMMDRELEFYDSLINRMLDDGEHRGTVMHEYGDIYWDVEEASFLRITQDTDTFYQELLDIVMVFLQKKGIEHSDDIEQIRQALIYQKMRIPDQKKVETEKIKMNFDFNFPEYFDRRFNSNEVKLQKKPMWLEIMPPTFEDKKQFAKVTVLWGRKSGAMLVKGAYGDLG
jgi:radical SAM superfamily enzyme YgiQ (UPF0313 family)